MDHTDGIRVKEQHIINVLLLKAADVYLMSSKHYRICMYSLYSIYLRIQKGQLPNTPSYCVIVKLNCCGEYCWQKKIIIIMTARQHSVRIFDCTLSFIALGKNIQRVHHCKGEESAEQRENTPSLSGQNLIHVPCRSLNSDGRMLDVRVVTGFPQE